MKLIFSTFFLMITMLGFAQQSFSLQEAINFALENNRTAQNASRDIEAAKKQKWETTATGLPQIKAALDYQNFLKQPVSPVPAEFFGGEPGTFQFLVFSPKQSLVATATLEQLIFDGSYLVGLQSAKVFLEISKNAKVKTDLEVRKLVIDAYGNVLLAEESIKILEKNKATLEKNLFETQKTFENGLAEEESIEQLQITLAGIESNLNNTKRLKDIAYKMLNIVLGLDINDTVILTDNLEGLASENIISGVTEPQFILEDNIDYLIAKNNEYSKELLLKFEKSKALPTLRAFVNGGYQGFTNENGFTFLNSGQPWFGQSILGVSMNIPIFSSLGRSATTQRAKIELEKAKADLTETEQRLKLEVEKAQSDFRFSIEQYQTSKQNLALAERIENKNQIKYAEGLASSFELREAQTQLYTTQQEYLQSMLNVINNKATLETIVNSSELINTTNN